MLRSGHVDITLIFRHADTPLEEEGIRLTHLLDAPLYLVSDQRSKEGAPPCRSVRGPSSAGLAGPTGRHPGFATFGVASLIAGPTAALAPRTANPAPGLWSWPKPHGTTELRTEKHSGGSESFRLQETAEGTRARLRTELPLPWHRGASSYLPGDQTKLPYADVDGRAWGNGSDGCAQVQTWFVGAAGVEPATSRL